MSLSALSSLRNLKNYSLAQESAPIIASKRAIQQFEAVLNGTTVECLDADPAKSNHSGNSLPLKTEDHYKTNIMKAGEAVRGDDVRELVKSYDSDINAAAKKYNVDPDLICAIIYEEQTHLLPLEDEAERKGIGNTVGLGQITIGLYGYTRDQLLDPATNIQVLARHLSTIQQKPYNTYNHAPIASVATQYNCGSCTTITDYGMRVYYYRLHFVFDSWK
jgi:soluble lytic murein transglycosylase-like protein